MMMIYNVWDMRSARITIASFMMLVHKARYLMSATEARDMKDP